MKQLNLQKFQNSLRNKYLKSGVKMIAPDTIYFSKDTKIGKNVTIEPYVVIGSKVKIGNGDSMFHVNKGTFGLRIEGINTCTLDNISINNIESFGEEGSYLAGNYQKSHPKQAHLNGYLGNPIFGLDINASNDINVENLSINSISSKTGSASGICINGESIKVSLKNSTVENIKSCQDSFDSKKAVWPNQPTNSRGLVVGAKCDLTTQNLILRNIDQTPNCLVPSDCELYSVIKNS
tara:strand:+ start:29 stop:736 length:708 start_codon:yes stop_codon:yes gene_type:complete